MFVPKSDLIRLLNAFGTISDLPIELVLSLHYSLLIIPLKFFLYDGSRIWITPYSTLKSRHFALSQMLVDIFVKFTNVLAFFSDISMKPLPRWYLPEMKQDFFRLHFLQRLALCHLLFEVNTISSLTSLVSLLHLKQYDIDWLISEKAIHLLFNLCRKRVHLIIRLANL